MNKCVNNYPGCQCKTHADGCDDPETHGIDPYKNHEHTIDKKVKWYRCSTCGGLIQDSLID